ncbi:MAG: class I SAM-dependent DNA methyltransferase, partial [Pseudorhodobacter sp.]|nr:class I SAM-dependent DNA methyltransferase [Pseudorhodobacter sp.]
VLGIEINPYAAELARVSVWIGEIQWMRRNGFEAAKNPILRRLETIENRDAVLAPDGTRAEWPKADVVVGNPPFLGSKLMLERLGAGYTSRLRAILPSDAPAVNLVTYWFFQAGYAVKNGAKRVGFVATNMVRSPANIALAKDLYDLAPIRVAWGDEPWVVDGASVRVSLIVCASEWHGTSRLDGKEVAKINSDLKALSVDLGLKKLLVENRKRAVRGVEKGGPFELSRIEAQAMLAMPLNPNGRPNGETVRRYLTVSDIVGRGDDGWIVDFFGLEEAAASLFEAPFALVQQRVQSTRAGNREARQVSKWWLFRRSGEQARDVLAGKMRVLTTGLVTKHRVFRWHYTPMVPDTRVILIDTEDDLVFGVLSSRMHELWTLSTCQFHGVGNDPVYTPSDCFETFPFPQGLTPNLPAAAYAADPRAQKIAAAAARLNELREAWLNPPDLVKRVPEVVPGYPDRLLPVSPEAAAVLKKRTLTNLYNARPAWLAHAHAALDEAVAEAYGWGDDWRAGLMTDDEILARLFVLNQARAAIAPAPPPAAPRGPSAPPDPCCG